MYEYLRNAQYNECNSCNDITQFTCMKCDYCYIHHWKKEKEIAQLEQLAMSNHTFLERYSQSERIEDHICNN
jgi:hypothetical protein